MKVEFFINEEQVIIDCEAGECLADTLRKLGCVSVKIGCREGECGACTIWVDDVPILSCKYLTAQAEGKHITTLEGVQKEAEKMGSYLLDEAVEQCGFCTPGLIMLVLAMKRELKNPSKEEIQHYIQGNLCRCSGYLGRMRAIEKYMNMK